MAETPTSTTLEAIEAAHEDLHGDHATLHGLVAQIRGAADSTRLPQVVRQLHALLQEHFEREEHLGGFYESLAALDMSFDDRVRQLVDEHKQILAAIRVLVEQTERGAGPHAEHLAVARQLADWLGRHEDQEHRLAEEAAGLLI